jgi:tetratricopeptide (TPR) repeat protein
MWTRLIARQAVAALLSGLLLCPFGSPQSARNAQDRAPSIDPKRAQKAIERGEKAEAEGRMDEALAAYDEAARYAPNDVAVVGRSAALRSRMVRGHVEAAERLALESRLREAVDELNKALAIDTGNTIVAQRLIEMKTMEEEVLPPQNPEPAAGLPQLKPEPGRKNLSLRGDTKAVYEQLAAAFGLRVAFDPDLQPKNVRLALNDVDFFTAAGVLATQSKTFWRVLEPTLLFVTPDTPEKQRQYGVELEQTLPLRASVGPEDTAEVLRVLRDITGATHIELNAREHSVTMRDTPEKLALAAHVIQELEQARGELMLEVDLLEVDRDSARNLGVDFPQKAQLFSIPPNLLSQLRQAKDLNSLLSLLTGIFGTAATGGAFSLGSVIPPLIAVGGGKSTFLLTLPGAAAHFSEALTTVQSGRKVLMRMQQGKPATFFVGDRFPVTLSLLSGTLTSGAVGVPAGSPLPFPSTAYDVGTGPVALVAADFRNLGVSDLAVVNEIDNSVSILLNEGGTQEGTFKTPATTISLGAARAAAPAIKPQITSDHLTSSGFHDLLITDPTANTVRIFLSNGDGTFKEATGSPITAPNQPSAIVTGDFNGDGNVDFAVTSFSASEVSVFLGDGTGAFKQAAGSPFALPAGVLNPVAMVEGDFNNDGKADLAIVANNNAPSALGELVVLLGQGNATFLAAGPATTVGNGPVALATGDFDASGSLDVAVLNQTDASVTVLLNHGDGTFALGANSPLSVGASTVPTGLAVADVDKNGTPDILVSDSGTNTFSVFLNGGQGVFAFALEPPAGTNPSAIIAAPLGGSIASDVAITNDPSSGTGQVTVVLNPTTFLGTNAANQQPYPGSEYLDLGVKVKATPVLHTNNEVTLQLEFEIRALAGTSINGIPIISNRTITQTVRVKEDQPTLLDGLTDREETRSITGLPGFATLPVIGYAFGTRNNSVTDTELVILITPRRLRAPGQTGRSVYAGRGDTTPRREGAAAPPPP